MTWVVTVVVWLVTGATGFAFSRWLVARKSPKDSQQDGSQAPAWLERHQRLHTHASLATKRQSIDGSRRVVRREILKLHLSPHFMFNALSSVQWLWGEGRIDEAKQVFPSFVQLWRAHWREEGDRVHSLGAEFETLEQYVRLEEIRLGRVVQWNVRCEHRAWLDTLIPSLITQPAVENAIWHGFGGHEGPHAIEISVSPSPEAPAPGWLDIVIRDNGSGLKEKVHPVNHNSVGMEVTRNRLREHHHDARIVMQPAAAPWSTEVIFSLPPVRSSFFPGEADELGQPG